MRRYLAVFSLLVLLACTERKQSRILVFSRKAGFVHESIPTGKAAIAEIGARHQVLVDTTEDHEAFTEENLKNYAAVIFLSTTGDVLNANEQADFERYIQAGGGYVGIHSATDTEYDWPWYGKLVGAYFKSHPAQQEATYKKAKPSPLTDGLPDNWIRKDEIYNFKGIYDSINVLYTVDESTYQGGENGAYHPFAWYHDFDGGRSFYTSMGHTNESFADSLYRLHLWKGIEYAIGNGRLDYSKVQTERVPPENRFNKVVLGYYFNEPTEMTILPDGRIMFIERAGPVKLYDPQTDSIKVINRLTVFSKLEDGMMGLARDPDFEHNHFIYIYYSHATEAKNILSRFYFNGSQLDMKSEKQILIIPTQRDQCCHTGGSLAFDGSGNLFLSTGDNTSPFESDGFSPSDERPGRSPFDAQKSSSNTNDLRGKILRIHPEPDGTYTIPEGNLFPKGEARTRGEIYVMGNRNPYRISVDKKTGTLYWGEVGPDSGVNDSIRGPRGYDEINRASAAGFYGWPYFVGNNYAYGEHDFANKKTGPKHDPDKPVNNSPNNTGKIELPPAHPALIWYPYGKSDEFPLVKTGGRNAMAGPVYHSEYFKGSSTAFPVYFDNKIMIYDWMRNWIMMITLDMNGNFVSMVPFLPTTTFNNIIDMDFGPDGRLYTLEYGTAWNKQNLDSRLSRIEYNPGNRAPGAVLKADHLAGAVPLTVNLSAKGTKDPENDAIQYELTYGEKKIKSMSTEFSITLEKPGIYKVVLSADDQHGGIGKAETIIQAGNEPPVIEISVQSKESGYFLPDESLKYEVVVTDKEDGSSSSGDIKLEDVKIRFDYFPKGYDISRIAQGHLRPELPGKLLMAQSDCKSCHLTDTKSAGPGLKEIAKKYKDQPAILETLSDKVLKGGNGNWGKTAMAAHPQIKKEEALQMVAYIMSLGDQKQETKLGFKGTVKTGKDKTGTCVISVSYDDKGNGVIPSIHSEKAYILKSK